MLVSDDRGIPFLGISLRLGSTGLMTDIVCNIFVLQSLTQDPLLGTQMQARNKAQEDISGARRSPSVPPGGGGDEQVDPDGKACRAGTGSNGLDAGLATHLDLKNMVPSGRKKQQKFIALCCLCK